MKPEARGNPPPPVALLLGAVATSVCAIDDGQAVVEYIGLAAQRGGVQTNGWSELPCPPGAREAAGTYAGNGG